MQVDIYVSRVVTEKLTVEVQSSIMPPRRFGRDPANLVVSTGTILGAEFVGEDGRATKSRWYPSMQLDEVQSTGLAIAPAEQMALRLVKANTVVSALAFNCMTPEDLAADGERDLGEVLASRDYI